MFDDALLPTGSDASEREKILTSRSLTRSHVETWLSNKMLHPDYSRLVILSATGKWLGTGDPWRNLQKLASVAASEVRTLVTHHDCAGIASEPLITALDPVT